MHINLCTQICRPIYMYQFKHNIYLSRKHLYSCFRTIHSIAYLKYTYKPTNNVNKNKTMSIFNMTLK